MFITHDLLMLNHSNSDHFVNESFRLIHWSNQSDSLIQAFNYKKLIISFMKDALN